MTDESPQSILHALKTNLAEAGGVEFAGINGLYAVRDFIDDLKSQINVEIREALDAMQTAPAGTDRRAVSVLVYNEKTDSSSHVESFAFSAEGMAEAVIIARDIAKIGRPIVPVIECIGTDASWYLGPDDLKLFFHLSRDPRALAAHSADYLTEKEPS